MPATSKVLLSPSKVTDLARFFRCYPQYPLRTDLLLDLMLYPRLVLARTGYGRLWSLGEIEQGQWRHSFEDLLNLRTVETVQNAYFPTPDEMQILSRRTGLHRNEKGADLAFFYLSALTNGYQLLHRPEELHVFDQRSVAWIEAMGAPSQAVYLSQPNLPLYEVALWVVKVQIPTVFSRPANLQPSDNNGSCEVVWIDPHDLVEHVLKRHGKDLEQLRSRIADLAAKAPSELSVNAYIAAERRKLKKALRIGDFSISVVGLLLELASAPYIHALSPFVKLVEHAAKRKVADRLAERPYRWLLMTEEIEATLGDKPNNATVPT